MWDEETKACAFMLLLALLLCSAWGALHGQEQEQWYLISEQELRSIERYRENSMAEKQSLLLQARLLRESSGSLSLQLAEAREGRRRLELSFERFAQGQLALTSSKNGEIMALSNQLADQRLKTAAYKSAARLHLFAALALAAAWAALIGWRLWRKFRLRPG
jgi:hypothetical protein